MYVVNSSAACEVLTSLFASSKKRFADRMYVKNDFHPNHTAAIQVGIDIHIGNVIRRNHSKDSAKAAEKRTTQRIQRGIISIDAKKFNTKSR